MPSRDAIRIDADAKAAVAELRKLADEFEKSDKTAQKPIKTSKAAAEEARRSIALQRRLVKDLETDEERYARTLAEARQALKGNANETELLRRLEVKLAKERVENSEEYQQQQRETREALERSRRHFRELGEESDEAFDPAPVAAWTAGIGAAITGVRALYSELSAVREEAERFADQQRQSAATAGSLVQLAGGDSAARDRLFGAANTTFGEGFVRTREEAEQLIFELESAGRLLDRRFFSRLSTIDNAGELAKSAGLIATGFEGGDAVGNSADIISKAIAGALPATGVSPSQIAEGVATAAATARPFGFSDEELFAAVSRVSQVTGSGSEAGTRVRRLLAALTRQGVADELSGASLSEVIASVGARGLSSAELTKYLGSVEAVQAFSVLQNRGALQDRLGEIAEAQATSLAERTIENALGASRIDAAVRRRAGEAADILSRERVSTRTNLAIGQELSREAARRDRGQLESLNRFESFMDVVDRTLFGTAGVEQTRQFERARESAAARGEDVSGRSGVEVLVDQLDRQRQLQEKQLSEQSRIGRETIDAINRAPATIPVSAN